MIPIRKYLLSEEERSQPIPALSDRQFVVQESKLTQPETDLQKELFWYREHLFHCIRGQWREVILLVKNIHLSLLKAHRSGAFVLESCH